MKRDGWSAMDSPLYKELGSITVPSSLFSAVGFFVSGKVDPQLIQLLESGGGRQKLYPTVGVSHFIVGEDADQDKIGEAKDIFDIPIVSPRWILYSAKAQKVLPVNGFKEEGTQLFSGLTFTTSKIREEDLSSVWALVTYHNGLLQSALTKKCTHLLTNETTGRKYETARKLNLPILCIDWITDSVKAGKLMSEKHYDPILLTPVSPSRPLPPPPARPAPASAPPPPSQNNSTENHVAVKAIGENISKLAMESPQSQKPAWIVAQLAKKTRQPFTEQKPQIMDQINGAQTSVPQRIKQEQSQDVQQTQQPSLSPNQSQQGVTRLLFQQPNSGQQITFLQNSSTDGSEKKFPVQVSASSVYNNTVIRLAPPEDQRQIPQAQQAQTEGQGQMVSQQQAITQHVQTSSRPPHPLQDSRHFTNSEQLEIIRQIQSDPQIKLQWAQMDHQQRTLLIQKLAQRNREDRLRREMMIRQQQMQLNHIQHQSANSQVLKINSSLQDQQQQPIQQNHAPLTQTPTSRPAVPLNPEVFQQNLQIRSRFPIQRPQAFQNANPIRQAIVSEDFGKDITLMEAQSHQQQELVFTQSVRPPQSPMNQNSLAQGQSPIRRQMTQSIFIPRANLVGSPVQRQILVTQHQAGAIIRTEQQQSTIIPTSQQQHTPTQKVQAYLQNNMMPGHERQQHVVPSSSQQPMEISRTQQQQHFYTTQQLQLNTTQQRFNVRHIVVQGQAAQQHLGEPQQSSGLQQSPVASQPTSIQWSPNATQTQRLISPPATITLSQQRQVRPVDQASQQQQWTIRTPHQGGVIYTSQPNMPFPQVVNSKTKTALANLLSNRLMGSATPEVPTPGVPVLSRSPSPQSISSTPVASMSSPVQSRVTLQSGKPAQQPHLIQRRTLSNLTNSDKVPLSNNVPVSPRSSGSSSQSPSPSYPPQSSRFFGHDPSIKLPDGGFLLGCVFWGAQELRLKWQPYVMKHGGEVESNYGTRVTHVLCETQKFPEFQQCVREGKRLVTLFWLNDVISRRCLSSPFQALHLPLPFSENERPYYGELISMTGFTREENERVQTMCALLGLTVTSTFSKANIGLIAKKPEGMKFLMAREWRKPVVNIQFLNELLFGHTGVIQMIHSPKYQQFNMTSPFSFDMALVVPLMSPWKTPLRVSNEAFERYRSLKRPADSSPPEEKRIKMEIQAKVREEKQRLFPEVPAASSEAPEDANPVAAPWSGVSVILTGFTDPMKELLTEKILELSGRVTEDRHVATHLIAKENCLTKKLLLFLCIKEKIVGIEWLRDSYAQRKFLDASSYQLTTAKSGIYQINYSEILSLPNRNRLFSELVFFLTPTVESDVKEIIEAAGGAIEHENSLKRVYEKAIKTPESFVVVTCEFDEYLLSGWRRNDGVEKIIIATKDTILGWIVTQNVTRSESKIQVTKVPCDLGVLPNEAESEKVEKFEDWEMKPCKKTLL